MYEEKKILFEEYAQEYLDYSKANKAWSTYKRRDRFSISHLISTFKGKYLFDVTPKMVEEYKAIRLQEVAPATVNREVACFKAMYNKAIEWGYAKVNPVKGIKKLKEPPGRLRYLKPEEVKSLIKYSPEHIRPIVVTALNTGMRKGEILDLKWSRVDMKNRKITVANAKNNETRVIPINRHSTRNSRIYLRNLNVSMFFLTEMVVLLKRSRTAFHPPLRKQVLGILGFTTSGIPLART